MISLKTLLDTFKATLNVSNSKFFPKLPDTSELQSYDSNCKSKGNIIMMKVLMGRYPEISEVKVNIEDIKLKNNKYYVNGEEHAMLCETSDILEVFYTGVKKALNGEITIAEAEAFLEKLKIK